MGRAREHACRCWWWRCSSASCRRAAPAPTRASSARGPICATSPPGSRGSPRRRMSSGCGWTPRIAGSRRPSTRWVSCWGRGGRALDGALAAQRTTVDALQQAREERVSALEQEQDALAELDATRDRIVGLISHLKEQLQPGDVGDVARAFQGADHVAYGDWADLLLKVLGAPTCRDNRILVVSWQVQEFTQAAWNPLATTHRMPGSTSFNSVGVQNYVSLQQGLRATDDTIANGWDVYGYGAIVRSLRSCAPALATAHAIAASSWCPGCLNGMYVVGVVPKVEADFGTYASL